MTPMRALAVVGQVAIDKFRDVDPGPLGPAEAHAQRFRIKPEAVGDHIRVFELRNQIGIEAKPDGPGAVAGKDKPVRACQLVLVKVDDVLDNLAAVEIDRLAVDIMRMEPLVKITGTVTNDNHIKALVPKIGGQPHANMIILRRAFHTLGAAAILVGIGGNPAAMDIDKPVIAVAVVEIGIGRLFAIAA